MGNRGGALHNHDREIIRQYASRRARSDGHRPGRAGTAGNPPKRRAKSKRNPVARGALILTHLKKSAGPP